MEPAAASIRKRPPPTARSARRSIRRSGVSVRPLESREGREPGETAEAEQVRLIEVQPAPSA